jgi:hydrogenase maturation protease
VVIAGLGNEHRRDDGAGPATAALVGELLGSDDGVDVFAPLGDPLDLLGRWDGAEVAIVIDALGPNAPLGSLEVLELGASSNDPGRAGPPGSVTSTHGIDLAGVLRLAEAVGQAPDRVVVVGIGGSDFGRGTRLSPGVAAAVPQAARRVLELVRRCQPCA